MTADARDGAAVNEGCVGLCRLSRGTVTLVGQLGHRDGHRFVRASAQRWERANCRTVLRWVQCDGALASWCCYAAAWQVRRCCVRCGEVLLGCTASETARRALWRGAKRLHGERDGATGVVARRACQRALA